MVRLERIVCTAFAAILFAATLPSSAHANDTRKSVTIYAGPQSVSPGDIISVTVEATRADGKSLIDEVITMSFETDGVLETLSAKTTQGLALFEVPAQIKSGLMIFSANASGVASKEARIVVTANPPQAFTFKISRDEQVGYVEVVSSEIADEFGNHISDLSLVSVDWIDASGLNTRQMVQPTNGHIAFRAPCPSQFSGTLKIRASVQAQKITTPDIAELCNVTEG